MVHEAELNLTGHIKAFHITRRITHLHIQITDLIITVIADTETMRDAKLQHGDRVQLWIDAGEVHIRRKEDDAGRAPLIGALIWMN